MVVCRVLPLAEVIMCGGFLFICLLEELIHHFIHPHQAKKPRVTPPKSVECKVCAEL